MSKEREIDKIANKDPAGPEFYKNLVLADENGSLYESKKIRQALLLVEVLKSPEVVELPEGQTIMLNLFSVSKLWRVDCAIVMTCLDGGVYRRKMKTVEDAKEVEGVIFREMGFGRVHYGEEIKELLENSSFY